MPVFNQWQAGQAALNAANQAAALSGAQSQAATKWRAGMPQAALPTPGIEDPNGVPVQYAQPGQPITREAILKHTMAGLNNPRTAQEAALVGQSLTSDLTRKEDQGIRANERVDDQAFRASESSAAQAFRASESEALRAQQRELREQMLQQQKDQLEAQMADRRLSREQQAELAKMHDTTMRTIAAMNNETRLAAAEATKAQREATTAATTAHRETLLASGSEKQMQKNVQHLQEAAKDIAPMREAAAGIQELLDSTEVGTDGKSVNIPGLGFEGYLHPRLRSEQANVNRQKITKFANAMLRAQAGLSQTLSEQEKADLEVMSSGKFTQKEFERSWPSTVSKLNASIQNLRAGVPAEAHSEYRSRGGPDLSDIVPRPRTALPKTLKTTTPPGTALSPNSKTTLPAGASLSPDSKTTAPSSAWSVRRKE